MRDEKRRGARIAENGEQLGLQVRAQDRVDRAEGFVEQEQARVGDERASDADALRLAAGEFARPTGAIGGGLEADSREQFVDSRVRALARPAERFGHEREILGDGEMSEKPDALYRIADTLPERPEFDRTNVAPVDGDATLAEFDQTIDATKKRALSRSRCADDGEQLTGVDLERKAIESGCGATRKTNGGTIEGDGIGCVAHRFSRRNARATDAGAACAASMRSFIAETACVVSRAESASSRSRTIGKRASVASRTTGAA